MPKAQTNEQEIDGYRLVVTGDVCEAFGPNGRYLKTEGEPGIGDTEDGQAVLIYRTLWTASRADRDKGIEGARLAAARYAGILRELTDNEQAEIAAGVEG